MGKWVCLITWRNVLIHYSPWPGSGLFTNFTKTILIMHPNNIEEGGLFGQCHNFKMCMGELYLGSYIGYENPKAVGSKHGRINGKETFVRSPKRRRNILRKVMTWQLVHSNRNQF